MARGALVALAVRVAAAALGVAEPAVSPSELPSRATSRASMIRQKRRSRPPPAEHVASAERRRSTTAFPASPKPSSASDMRGRQHTLLVVSALLGATACGDTDAFVCLPSACASAPDASVYASVDARAPDASID